VPRFLPAILLAIALFSAGAARAEEEELRIKAIKVEGNRRVEIDAIKAVLSTKAGQPLDRKKLQSDIRSVLKLGYFSDVVVEEEGDPKAPILVIRVREKPAVRDVKIVGNDELSNDDLKDTVDVKPFSILDTAALRRNAKKIQEKYVEKGYYLSEVKYEIDDQPDNQVSVRFVVNEHAKVQVKQVDFLGNTHVPENELKSVMLTQEGGLLSFVTSSGTYREEMLQRDLQALQALYMDHGYVNVKVGKPAVALSPDKRFLYVAIRIEEGEQYKIGKLDFSGDLLGHEKPAIATALTVREGETFNRSKLGHDMFGLSDLFRDEGYAYANVTPLTNIDAKTKTIDLTFDVQPGLKTFFEKIEVIGNSKTRDKVIRREMRVYEGELFSGTGIKISKQRVTALGFFEAVEVTTKKGSADDKIVATVEVKEKATGQFQVGAGFSSYENFILTAQISQNNFFGWGQTLSLAVQWSSIRQLGQIQFVEPYFLDTKWTFAFDLYATEGLYSTFVRKALGGSMTWGYELNGLSQWVPALRHLEDMRLFATYTNEHVNVLPVQTGNQLLIYNRFRSGTTSSVRLSMQWDKRDNRLFPTSGFFESVSAEAAPPALAPDGVFGRDVNLFSRYTLDSRYYRPIAFGLVGRLKVTAGYIRNWDENHPIPVSELYYLGGINSVRGYRLLSISPSVQVGTSGRPDADLYNFPVGGNKQLVVNLELEFPILEKVGIRGVLFYDMGNAFAAGRYDDPNVPFSLYKSVGFGFRWISPIGPLRFEWGIPLNPRQDPITKNNIDQPIDFQFTIGNFF
jgi:outer membrane protein insertion porin family